MVSRVSGALASADLVPKVGRRTIHNRITTFRKKSLRRRLVHYSLLAANVALLTVVGLWIARTSSARSLTGQTGATAMTAKMGSVGNVSAATGALVDPLDQLSSADIAVNVARAANLPEVIPITNQADSENVQLAVAQSSTGLVAKTQIVASNLKSARDIHSYTVQAGETAATIAAKFDITTNSVLWSNNLASEQVSVGQVLVLPPVSGIVYLAKAGDTPESLAQKYHTSADKIIAYNDAEIGGLKIGTRILIPEGQIVRQATVSYSGGYSSGFPWGGGPVYNGSNGYDYGYCTWYVANRIAVPSNWGNANTWDNLASRSGWTVSGVPSVGAIAQTDRGYFGHVAVVQAVSADGSQIKYADMNGIAGWGRVGYSDWVSVSRFEHYITH